MSINFNAIIPDVHKTGQSAWSPFVLMPQLVTIFIVTFLLMVIFLLYNLALKKQKVHEAPRGLVLLVELTIKWAESQVIDLLGVKYRRLSIYFLYMFLFIGIGNLMSIIGFESIVSDYTIPMTLGLVTFLGIYYFGFKYSRMAYFKKYLINPLEIIQQFVPMISISFRLFGNILGGAIMLTLFVTLMNSIWSKIPYLGPVDLLAGLFLPFLSIYFDIFDGVIQSYIFAILTISYWSLEVKQDVTSASAGKMREIEIASSLKTKNLQYHTGQNQLSF